MTDHNCAVIDYYTATACDYKRFWMGRCKLQNSVSSFWHSFMSYLRVQPEFLKLNSQYFLMCTAWKATTYDREQVTKYDIELSY